ncbi:hypothetical protein HNO88_000380 [Novosphingobium chloroacetimidivorans]|uniref:Glycosyltransferase RgtA/B/C/D-like domain-containing protein n=1 Tax=Novosphingobium chloroacetimidivorans TaxID=1428314 RepID=A0A7W7K7L9_9SPHN|nr:hypothetical protein [Novosphingobium chloroacetimidivorans]MBB4857083.1 hypothetical protein [Novosphingobium chloroacetimidivorans]
MPRLSSDRALPLGWLAAFAALLALVPVLFVPIAGFADAPAHLARHYILATSSSAGPLSRYFAVQWQWIANLGEDIPVTLLSGWLGAELATRLVTALIAPLTIAGVFALSRAAHGRISASAFLALPLVLNQAWMYGFLNYCLGIALALLTAAWLYARKPDTPRTRIGLALAALVVWTAHMASWATLLLLAAGNELVALRSVRDVWPAVRRNLPLLIPVVPLLLWRAHSKGSDFSWVYEDVLRTKVAVFAGALRGTWMKLDFAVLALVALAAFMALRWAGRRQVEPRLAISGLLLAAGALAAPEYLLNSWGTDLRTAPIAILMFVLAIAPARDPGRERLLCLAGLALFAARLGSVTWIWAERSPELAQRLTMLDAVPRGGRLGYIYVRPDCDGWALTPDEKLASYAVVRRQAFANTLFMVDNARLVTIRDPHLQERWSSDSQRVQRSCPEGRIDMTALKETLLAMRTDDFDAIWVSGVPTREVPVVAGYAVAQRRSAETMLVRKR